jgi:RNA 2',3'-cyclic 3'-phosphodiesterase
VKPMRTFVAVNVSSDTTKSAQRMMRQIDETGVGAKCVQTPSMHIALKFLGEVQIEDTPEICKAVGRAAHGMLSFMIECGGLGAFPERSRPRTIWMGVQTGVTALRQLQERVDEETRHIGYHGETRQFHPHLTLARIRSTAEQAEPLQAVLNKYPLGPDSTTTVTTETWVDEVIVYASIMERGTPSYEVLGRSRLR